MRMMKLGLAGIRLYPQTHGDFRVAQIPHFACGNTGYHYREPRKQQNNSTYYRSHVNQSELLELQEAPLQLFQQLRT
jgi:hypothetical protein